MNQMPGTQMQAVMASLRRSLPLVTASEEEFAKMMRRKKTRILTALAMQAIDWLERLGAAAAIEAIEERAREARERRTQ